MSSNPIRSAIIYGTNILQSRIRACNPQELRGSACRPVDCWTFHFGRRRSLPRHFLRTVDWVWSVPVLKVETDQELAVRPMGDGLEDRPPVRKNLPSNTAYPLIGVARRLPAERLLGDPQADQYPPIAVLQLGIFIALSFVLGIRAAWRRGRLCACRSGPRCREGPGPRLPPAVGPQAPEAAAPQARLS